MSTINSNPGAVPRYDYTTGGTGGAPSGTQGAEGASGTSGAGSLGGSEGATLPPMPANGGDYDAGIPETAGGEIPPDLQARLDDALSALQDANNETLATSGSSGRSIESFLAEAMMELASNQRKAAMENRSLGYEAAKQKANDQADQMNKAADKMDAGATTNLIISSVMAGVSMGMSAGAGIGQAKNLGGMARANKGMAGAPDPSTFAMQKSNMDLSNARLNSYSTVSGMAQSVDSMGRTGGSTKDARMQADAKREDALGAKDAADVSSAQQRADLAKGVQDAVEEMIKKIIEYVKELADAKTDMMQSITRA